MSDKPTLEELQAKQSCLYDQFTRASASRSGSILKQLCEVDTQIAKIKRERRKGKEKHPE